MKAKVEFTLPTGIRLPGNQHIPCKFDEKTRRSAAKSRIPTTTAIRFTSTSTPTMRHLWLLDDPPAFGWNVG